MAEHTQDKETPATPPHETDEPVEDLRNLAVTSPDRDGEGMRDVSNAARLMGIDQDVFLTRLVWDRWMQPHDDSIVKQRLDTLLWQIKDHLPGILEGRGQSEYLYLHFPCKDSAPTCAMEIRARWQNDNTGRGYIEVDDMYGRKANDEPDRTEDRFQELTLEVKSLREELEQARRCPHRLRLPETRKSLTHKFSVSGHEGYITVGLYPDGRPGELFITMAKEGSTVGGLMDCFGIAVSMSLQLGTPLHTLVNKFSHTRFEPMGHTQNPDIRFATSLVDYIFRWLALEFPPEKRPDATLSEQNITPPNAP